MIPRQIDAVERSRRDEEREFQQARDRREEAMRVARQTMQLLDAMDNDVAGASDVGERQLVVRRHLTTFRSLLRQLPDEELRRRMTDVAELLRLHWRCQGANHPEQIVFGATGCARDDLGAWLRGESSLPEQNSLFAAFLDEARNHEWMSLGSGSHEFEVSSHFAGGTSGEVEGGHVGEFLRHWRARYHPARPSRSGDG